MPLKKRPSPRPSRPRGAKGGRPKEPKVSIREVRARIKARINALIKRGEKVPYEELPADIREAVDKLRNAFWKGKVKGQALTMLVPLVDERVYFATALGTGLAGTGLGCYLIHSGKYALGVISSGLGMWGMLGLGGITTYLEKRGVADKIKKESKRLGELHRYALHEFIRTVRQSQDPRIKGLASKYKYVAITRAGLVFTSGKAGIRRRFPTKTAR